MISFIRKVFLHKTCPYQPGDIYITASPINPNIKWPWTSWEPFAVGKTIFGIDPNDTDFDTVEQTGGAKGAWYHNHTEGSHTHTVSGNFRWNSGTKLTGYSRANNGTQVSASAADYGAIAASGSTNNQQPIELGNMQPYIVTYMWKRMT